MMMIFLGDERLFAGWEMGDGCRWSNFFSLESLLLYQWKGEKFFLISIGLLRSRNKVNKYEIHLLKIRGTIVFPWRFLFLETSTKMTDLKAK